MPVDCRLLLHSPQAQVGSPQRPWLAHPSARSWSRHRRDSACALPATVDLRGRVTLFENVRLELLPASELRKHVGFAYSKSFQRFDWQHVLPSSSLPKLRGLWGCQRAAFAVLDAETTADHLRSKRLLEKLRFLCQGTNDKRMMMAVKKLNVAADELDPAQRRDLDTSKGSRHRTITVLGLPCSIIWKWIERKAPSMRLR